jgi:Asx homology domain
VDDPPLDPSIETMDPSFFKDMHFLAALRTFQDHLYMGWMTPSHKKDVETYIQGIHDGTLHAPWKDQVWERDNREDDVPEIVATSSPIRNPSRAGYLCPFLFLFCVTSLTMIVFLPVRSEAKDIKLTDLIRSGVVRIGDILVYKRAFALLSLTVERDAIVRS